MFQQDRRKNDPGHVNRLIVLLIGAIATLILIASAVMAFNKVTVPDWYGSAFTTLVGSLTAVYGIMQNNTRGNTQVPIENADTVTVQSSPPEEPASKAEPEPS